MGQKIRDGELSNVSDALWTAIDSLSGEVAGIKATLQETQARQAETDAKFERVLDKLDFLSDLLLRKEQEQQTVTATMTPDKQPSDGNAKPIQGADRVFSAPPDLDIEIEVKVDQSGAARSSENLRRSLWALHNGTGAWAAKEQ
jgi:hypothetical protein